MAVPCCCSGMPGTGFTYRAPAPLPHRYQRSRECSTSAGAAGPGATPAAAPLPMLASACPGWVCYAEKTQADLVLPYISTTKSPQAVMGTFVKRRLAAAKGWDPARVYHCSVMPCYDKKLEASREDFNLPGGWPLRKGVGGCL